MKQIVTLLLFSTFSVSTFAQKNIERPKLVVGVVVDQMRWDYLYRFYDRYSANGFKRLMNDGFNCQQTMINYLPAYTAPGHACIYTGSVPSIHGIAGNNWIDNNTGKHWYCTEDTSVSPVGGSKQAGMMSPKNMLVTTVTDELRLATNFKSRVFGFSLKDRGAIIPAGHLANGAYWYDDSTGSFISSSFYGNTLPAWLNTFNNQRLPDTFLRQPWETLYPINTYTQSIKDNNRYEGNFSGEKNPVFPHIVKSSSYPNMRRLPSGNTYTFHAAKACIEGEYLGMKNETDFLCISLSSPDYIGHQFAPNSVEVEDTYLRLDKDLGDFITYLDKKLGKGNYLMFLTADHGGAHNASYLNDIKIPAGNEQEGKILSQLKELSKTKFGTDELIRGYDNYQVFLDHKKLESHKIEEEDLKIAIKEWFYKSPQVAYVLDMQEMDETPVPEPILTKAINGYHRLRSGDLLVIYNPGWYHGYGQTGTTHGTWHPYDSHIPLLWYGWKIKKGSSNRTINMEDIAATLAAMLHIQMPNGCIGKVISEVAP
ncbi:MAG TPA: alkaline phosphatase family protein [Flavipsychrobacter sp.]|nr:alkaline phosphatase family protein [Flavipsychrobacter sp.]